MFYKWKSKEEFDFWHLTVKEALGIPYPNKNSETGVVDENATWTTTYTTLYIDHSGAKFAKVEDEVAQQFSEGLGEPYEPYYEIGN